MQDKPQELKQSRVEITATVPGKDTKKQVMEFVPAALAGIPKT